MKWISTVWVLLAAAGSSYSACPNQEAKQSSTYTNDQPIACGEGMCPPGYHRTITHSCKPDTGTRCVVAADQVIYEDRPYVCINSVCVLEYFPTLGVGRVTELCDD